MITSTILAKRIESTLNQYIDAYELNAIIPNTVFEFKIFTDTADYKRAETDAYNPNILRVYINGVFKIMPGASNTGTSTEDFVGSATANVELLIPLFEELDENGNFDFLEKVKNLITNALQLNSSFDETDESGTKYIISAAYTTPTVLFRDVRAVVGDSVSITFDAGFGYVAGGISSNDIQLFVYTGNGDAYTDTNSDSWQRIRYSKLGVARNTALNPNTFSDGDGASKCTSEGTSFTVSFDAATRSTALDKAAIKYAFLGDLTPIYIRLDVIGDEISKVYKMVFEKAGLSAEIPLAASTALILCEAL